MCTAPPTMEKTILYLFVQSVKDPLGSFWVGMGGEWQVRFITNKLEYIEIPFQIQSPFIYCLHGSLCHLDFLTFNLRGKHNFISFSFEYCIKKLQNVCIHIKKLRERKLSSLCTATILLTVNSQNCSIACVRSAYPATANCG